MRRLHLGELSIEHRINPRMKNSYVVIDKEAQVILKTPRISHSEAMRILEERSTWIHRKLDEQKRKDDYSYQLGREVRYFGGLHQVMDNILFDDLSSAIKRLRTQSEESLGRCYDVFYKVRAADHLSERMHYFEILTGLEASGIRFRKMKSRWGSCSSKRIITFNTQLMQLPTRLIDYVIVHELSHLRHMDHSKAFYKEVEKHLTDYRESQKALRNIRIS